MCARPRIGKKTKNIGFFSNFQTLTALLLWEWSFISMFHTKLMPDNILISFHALSYLMFTLIL